MEIQSVFTDGKALDERQINEMLCLVEQALPSYLEDQYRYYPAKDKDAWQKFLIIRLKKALVDREWRFFFRTGPGGSHLIGCRVSTWDMDHFGIKMSSMQVFVGHDPRELKQLIGECLAYLKGEGVAFVSTRVNGDNLTAVHALQRQGFLYYENIIWPVLRCHDIPHSPNVRLMEASDLDRVVNIANSGTFQRSHFHCDDGFSKESIDSMQAKWIKTSWEKKEPIAVVTSEGNVAGYFVFYMDESLSSITGYRYGRMRNLALDPEFRGQGLGKRIFGGSIGLMCDMGAEYIDSGYASKNHMSARLHVHYGFESVYEEVTMHLWLRPAD